MNIGGIGFADGDVDDYEYEPGSQRYGGGFQADFHAGAQISFDGANLPPPPDEPPPPVPGVEGEITVEKKKKKKKHREGERGEEGEDGERRHRKKKKKHREEGEDGEKRRHRRHRREAGEGEAAVEVEAPDVGVTLPEANVDLDMSGALPSSQMAFSHQSQFEANVTPAVLPGQFETGSGISAGVEVPAKSSVSALASRFAEIANNNSRPSSGSPRSMRADWRAGSPRIQAHIDPAVETTSVEDYYYRASPRDQPQAVGGTIEHSMEVHAQHPESVEVSHVDVGAPRGGLEVRDLGGRFDAPAVEGHGDLGMSERPPIGVRTHAAYEPRDQSEFELHGGAGFELPKPEMKVPGVKVKKHKHKHSKHAKPQADIEVPDAPNFVQGRAPELEIQGQPGFEGHGQPGFEVHGQPGFEVHGQPGFEGQGQPGFEGQGQPGFEGQGQPGFEVRGQPGFEVRGQPGFEMHGQPGFEVQGQPGFEMQGQPGFEVHGQSGFEVQGQPEFEMEGPPGVDGQFEMHGSRPDFEIEGQHGSELQERRPDFEVQGQPDFELRGRRPEFDGQPGFEVQGGQPRIEMEKGQAGFDVKGVQPELEVKGRAGFEMQGQSEFEMPAGQPRFEMQGRPEFEMQGRPEFEMQGRPEFEMQGRPEFEMQGRPEFEMQGRPGFEVQGGFMPGEPGHDQQRYSINEEFDVHDDGVPQSMQPHEIHGQVGFEGPAVKQPKKKDKGGIFGLFGKKGKKPAQESSPMQAHLSGPGMEGHLSGPGVEATPVSVGGSGGGNFGPSPFVGSPMSTMRSGDSEVQRDPWQSNPQLFNPNAETIDPHMRGVVAAPNVTGRAGKKGKKLPSTRPIPTNKARVILLDGEEIDIPVDKKAPGREIFDRVCDHQSIEERDYFGLTFVNRKEQTWFWLDVDKKISKQLKNGEVWFFNFQVKFYPPEPALLQEDITRYQLSLQVRQDIFTGKLPCSWVTQALLGSLLVQSEIGDFDEDEHGTDIEYLNDFQFVHTQNEQLLNKIAELHRNHKGMNPGQADLKYLETAKRLELYGYDLHPARDLEDIDIYIGVSFTGIVVYRGHLRISRFAWPKVLRISYRKNFFYLKIRSDYYEDVEAVVGFKLFNHKLSKRLWKIAVEHHTFFRLKEPRFATKTSTMPRFGSRHRYSGRTFYQYRTMSINRPQGNPHFDRSLTKRRTASMPMLAGNGSQYGSMHSLTRQHPRDMTLGKMQSVEYLGPVSPRTPSMTRSGSVEMGSRSGSVLGGSMQHLPDSAGNRVLLHGGTSVSARAGAPLVARSKVGAESPQMQHFHTDYSPDTSGARVNYQVRTNRAPDQASLDGSEAGGRRPVGAVRLPIAPVRRVAGSVTSGEEDLL